MDQGGALPLGAKILTVAEMFSLGSFAPASVQRDYQWEEKQCQELFSDLERVFAADENARADEPDGPLTEGDGDDAALDLPEEHASGVHQRDYFLGAVVLRPIGNNRFEIFDGLQRLTSLTILLAVLRDLVSEPAITLQLDQLIARDDATFRLILSGNDTTLRDEAQKRGEAGKSRRSPISDMGARIRGACTLFRRELSRWNGARRAAFSAFLLHRVRLVSIAAADASLASQIFVTTNARGRPLDKVELFKGQLIDISQDAATGERIAQSWANVQTIVGDDLEDLLGALDFIERREPQGAERLTQLADHLSKRYGAAGIGRWVDRLDLFGVAWKELHLRLLDPADPDVGASIWKLRLFKWREWKPLGLIWYAQFMRQKLGDAPSTERARALFARRFDALHRRCMAITLAGNSDLDRTKIFGRAISQVARKRDPLDRQGALGFEASAHGRIQETLRLPLIHDETRLTLLRWIEAALWEKNPPRAITRASVEHLLPVHPHSGSLWFSEFPQEDARFNVCHALGNLALIDYKANSDIGNGDFKAKLPALTVQAEKYRTLADVIAQPSWTADTIAARSKRLYDFAWREMQLPAPRTPRIRP